MSQQGYTYLDTPICFQQKQQVVLWVTQRLMSYSKVGTLFFNGSKFVFGSAQNRLQYSRWSAKSYHQWDFIEFSFLYLPGETPFSFVNTLTKWGISLNPTR